VSAGRHKTTALCWVRGVWGLALLMAPGRLTRPLATRPPTPTLRSVVRVLGAREVVQAAVISLRPDRRVLIGAAVVDAMHSTSMILLAAREAKYRRLAGASAMVSTLLGTATVREARRAPH
jgi:hypothetical protein